MMEGETAHTWKHKPVPRPNLFVEVKEGGGVVFIVYPRLNKNMNENCLLKKLHFSTAITPIKIQCQLFEGRQSILS